MEQTLIAGYAVKTSLDGVIGSPLIPVSSLLVSKIARLKNKSRHRYRPKKINWLRLKQKKPQRQKKRDLLRKLQFKQRRPVSPQKQKD